MQLRQKNPQKDVHALWRVAETNDTDAVAAVLAKGVDINSRNDCGVTALMRAAAHGRVRMVRALLEHGADPNVRRNDHFTALLLGAFFGHEDVVKILVAHGADTTAVTRFETSAQMWAAARTFGAVVGYLDRQDSAKQIESNEDVRAHQVAEELQHPLPTDDFDSRSWWPGSAASPLWRRISTVAGSIIVFALIGLLTDHVLQPEIPHGTVPLPQQHDVIITPPIVNTNVVIPLPTAALTSTTTSTPATLSITTVFTSGDKKPSKSVRLESPPFVPPRNEQHRERQQAVKVASAEVKKEEPIEIAAPTVPLKSNGPVSREPLPPKTPVPQTSQIITSSRSSAPGGKVIKWP